MISFSLLHEAWIFPCIVLVAVLVSKRSLFFPIDLSPRLLFDVAMICPIIVFVPFLKVKELKVFCRLLPLFPFIQIAIPAVPDALLIVLVSPLKVKVFFAW